MRSTRSRTPQGLVLMNHGLITWGDSVQEAYERHIELVTRAEQFRSAGGSAAAAVRDRTKAAAAATALQITRRACGGRDSRIR